MRLRTTIALLLLVSGTAIADVRIPQKCRVRNQAPGWCTWNCLETLGNFHGIEKLKNLTAKRAIDPDTIIWIDSEHTIVRRRNFGDADTCEAKLNSLGVKFQTNKGYQDREFLIAACQTKGCMVFFLAGAYHPKEGHAVILTDYNDKAVQFIDPNTTLYYEAGRTWFDKYWNGYALTVEK